MLVCQPGDGVVPPDPLRNEDRTYVDPLFYEPGRRLSVCNLRTQKCEHLLARKASPVLPQSIAAVVLLQVVVVTNLLTIAISFLGQISKTSPGRDTLR